MIDELMARRPALDDCKTRYDKISKVITTAAQKDAFERERDELKKRLDERIGRCICGHYHCPTCGNQMEVLGDGTYNELVDLKADNDLLRKRLENFEKLWEWMRFTDKYHFCEDNGIRIEDMELKEG